RRIETYAERIFQAVVGFVVIGEKINKTKGVDIVESAVPETEEGLQVIFLVVQHEIVGGKIHHPQQFPAFVNNRFSLSPSQYCGNKTGNFDVLLFGKKVGDGDRVQRYKVRAVVPIRFFI